MTGRHGRRPLHRCGSRAPPPGCKHQHTVENIGQGWPPPPLSHPVRRPRYGSAAAPEKAPVKVRLESSYKAYVDQRGDCGNFHRCPRLIPCGTNCCAEMTAAARNTMVQPSDKKVAERILPDLLRPPASPAGRADAQRNGAKSTPVGVSSTVWLQAIPLSAGPPRRWLWRYRRAPPFNGRQRSVIPAPLQRR